MIGDRKTPGEMKFLFPQVGSRRIWQKDDASRTGGGCINVAVDILHLLHIPKSIMTNSSCWSSNRMFSRDKSLLNRYKLTIVE